MEYFDHEIRLGLTHEAYEILMQVCEKLDCSPGEALTRALILQRDVLEQAESERENSEGEPPAE